MVAIAAARRGRRSVFATARNYQIATLRQPHHRQIDVPDRKACDPSGCGLRIVESFGNDTGDRRRLPCHPRPAPWRARGAAAHWRSAAGARTLIA